MDPESVERSIRHSSLRPRLYLLSALAKQAKARLDIDGETLGRLGRGEPRDRTVSEKLESLVRSYADRSGEIGAALPFRPELDYPLAFCRSGGEWSTLVDAAVEIGHLKKTERFDFVHGEDGDRSSTKEIQSWTVAVTPKGWEWLGSRPIDGGHDVFIAMAFAESQMPVKEAIQRAIESAGYTALRVDDDEYVGGIMDRVVAQIRKSRFVVVDFTLNRGGVYYEAGMALGLGIPCVHVCHQRCLDLADGNAQRLHFDVAHLATLPWTEDDLVGFAQRLATRIEAVFGRGPRFQGSASATRVELRDLPPQVAPR